MDYQTWQNRLAAGDDYALAIEACDNALTTLREEHLLAETRTDRRRVEAELKLASAIRAAIATSDMHLQNVIDFVERLRATTEAIQDTREENALTARKETRLNGGGGAKENRRPRDRGQHGHENPVRVGDHRRLARGVPLVGHPPGHPHRMVAIAKDPQRGDRR